MTFLDSSTTGCPFTVHILVSLLLKQTRLWVTLQTVKIWLSLNHKAHQVEIPAFRSISWSSGESSVKCGTANAQSTTVCDNWLQMEFQEYGGIASMSSIVCVLSELESILISADRMLSISISPPAVVLSASISPFSAHRSSCTATISNYLLNCVLKNSKS